MKARSCLLPLVLVLWLVCCSPARALLCYGGPVRVKDGRIAIVLEKNPYSDGVCVRWQYFCSRANECDRGPADVGKWKWSYALGNVQNCADMRRVATAINATNILCCTTDRCNAPDPKQDFDNRVLIDAPSAGGPSP
jgi:hypothetical protein